MTAGDPQHPELTRLLAQVLHYGSWLGSLVVAAGLCLSWAAPAASGMSVLSLGIAIFILLPILRLVVMLFAFLRKRDYRFAGITSLVLAIIVTGAVLGIYLDGAMAH
jgi:uncharacterized membrane protein